jgi:hypothetical protein
MPKDVIAVFTFRTREEIIHEGGSQAWVLNVPNAQRCRYLVCTRNRYTYPTETGPEAHGAAFLVGKITVIEPAPDRADRFIVRFDKYALLDPQPVVWPGSRNPVWYLNSLSDLQIDESALSWQPVLDSANTESLSPNVSELTGDAIRDAVARAYGVKPESVTITISL